MALIVEVTDSRNSEKKSRKTLKTTKVVCTQCSLQLGEMIETEPKLANNTELKHIFVCPCGGESFVVKVKYTAYFLANDGLITSSINDDGNNRFKSVLETFNGE
jgi:hypothetical protein